MAHLTHITEVLGSKISTCRQCIKKSFYAATLLWVMTLFVGAPYLMPLALMSSAATALWLAHIIVFTNRTQNRHSDKIDGTSRRQALTFLRSLLVVGASTILPSLAFAMGSCGSCENTSPYAYPPGCLRANYDGGNGCTPCRSCGENCGETVC